MHEVIHYIAQHNLIGIKAGKERNSFLEIWMVTLGNRIFARSWGFAEKSWYNTFIEEPHGQIQCGDNIYNITALVPDDLSIINERINEAYLHKYNHGRNAFYAEGIVEPQHMKKTMEFIIVE